MVIVEKLLNKGMHGLVLIAGVMATGKTSSAASLLVEYLKRHGGVAIALEDPVETPLNGLWGSGRCIQIPVSERRGGYKMAMRKALRTGASAMLIGEIRDSATAVEVVNASINGHFVISTIHAGSIEEAISRLSSYASELPNANQLLAEGLAMVIWVSISRSTAQSGQAIARMKAQALEVSGVTAVKAKVRDGRANSLQDDIGRQASQIAWHIEQSALD